MREELNRILAKETLSDADINILVKNIDFLSQEEKVRLGLSAPVQVKEPIVVEEEKKLEVNPIKEEVIFVDEAPKAKKTKKKK